MRDDVGLMQGRTGGSVDVEIWMHQLHSYI